MKILKLTILVFALTCSAHATKYYVDYVNGLDTNSGTSAVSPFKHAPDMIGCSNTCLTKTLTGGDQVVFKGGIKQTGTDSFTWTITHSGSAGNPIYIGVDQTFFDTAACQQTLGVTITNGGTSYSVTSPPVPVFSAGAGTGATGYSLLNGSGNIVGVVMTNLGQGYTGAYAVTFTGGGGSGAAGTAIVNLGWCRPIFDGNHINYDGHPNAGFNSIVYSRGNYITYDNIEVINVSAVPASISNAIFQLIAGSGSNQSEFNLWNHMYIHGWDTSVCFGIGNIAANSSTITNFVPTSGQCTSDILGFLSGGSFPYSMPIQKFPQGSYWAVQNGAPLITGVSGSNPYTITTNSATVPSVCTGCLIEFGGAANVNAFYGNQGGNIGSGVLNSVITGRDTFAVQINPYDDCGLSEGLNTPCIVNSIVAQWRGPQNWEGNTLLYIDNGAVGGCGILDQNTIGLERVGTNPTGHTNLWESIAPAGDYSLTGCLMYNNYFFATTMKNPSAPPGQTSIGLSIEPAPNTGQIAYAFNNVSTDIITNTLWEPAGSGGNLVMFNNTQDCGGAWSLSQTCTGPPGSGGTTTSDNNLYVTTAGSPYNGTVTHSGDILWTPTNATTAGFIPTGTYIYSPQNSNCAGVSPCTVGTGVSIASFCTALDSVFTTNATELAPFDNAGAACREDTKYGATYDPIHQTSTAGGRVAISRSTSAPNVGAFQFSGPIYVAQASAGGNTGVDCADARASSTLAAGDWVPGANIHLCGTFTGGTNQSPFITALGDGTTGNLITVTFEPGAILQASYFASSAGGTSTGAITLGNGHSWITIDGKNTGIIRNTANGSSLANQHATTAISGFNCNHCTIQNLSILDMYINVTGNSTIGDSSVVRAIDPSGPNWIIANNTFRNCGWCVLQSYVNNDTNEQWYGNTFTEYSHAFAFAAASAVNCISPCLLMHDNSMGANTSWDAPGCFAHKDGIHLFGVIWSGIVSTSGTAVTWVSGDQFQAAFAGKTININGSTFTVSTFNSSTSLTLTTSAGTLTNVAYAEGTVPKSSMDGIYIYNNYFNGDWGTCPTGFIFAESGSRPGDSPAGLESWAVWNNVGVVVNTTTVNTNGWITIASGASGSQQLINNTIIGNCQSDNSLGFGMGNLSALTYENNVSSCIGDPISISNSTISAANFNFYGSNVCQNSGNCFIWNGSFTGSFSAWKAACSCDANAVSNLTPVLNADGSPKFSSPVINLGTNLSAFAGGNLASLQSDTTKGGTRIPTVRPSGSASWEAGAFEFNNVVYITQSGTGTQSGADCSNTKPVTYFNTGGNWSSTPSGQLIGPGTPVYITGTFTGTAGGTEFTFQGDGGSGSVVSLIFSACGSAPDVTATYWGSAINTNSHNHILIDGGGTGNAGAIPSTFSPVGIIENTANGTALANQQASKGLLVPSGTDITIQNLWIRNIYQRSGTTTEAYDDTTAACIYGGTVAPPNQLVIRNNQMTGAGWCLQNVGASDQIIVDSNDISGMEHSASLAPVTLFYINNHMHDWGIWDGPCPTPCAYHHDGLHTFAGAGGQTHTLYFYGNQCDGATDSGTAGLGQFNQCLFIEGAGSPTTGMVDGGVAYIFNNVCLITVDAPGCLLDTGNAGSIASISVGAGGNGYSNGNILSISGGTSGTATVTSNSGGVVTGVSLSNIGTSYSTGTKTTTCNSCAGINATIVVTRDTVIGNQSDLIVNNTEIALSPSNTAVVGNQFEYITTPTIDNDAYSGFGAFISSTGHVVPTAGINFNFYGNCSTFNCWDVTGIADTGSFATWKASNCTGGANTCDQNSGANIGITTYLQLDSSCIPGSVGDPCLPTATSPLVKAGKNFFSVCNGQPIPGLGALCSDKRGIVRPTTGSWDSGANQFTQPPKFIFQTLFDQGFNKNNSPWCPVDGNSVDAQIFGYRVWDDGAKWGQLNTAFGTINFTPLDTHINTRAISGGCPGTPMMVLYTFGDTPYFASVCKGQGDPSPCLPGTTGTTAYGTTCSITATLAVLTCPSALFTSYTTEEGPAISITGAGPAGATLTTYITHFTNTTTVTIAVAASTTVSGTGTVTGLGFGGAKQCASPSDFSCTPLTDVTSTGGGTDLIWSTFVAATVARYAGKITYYEHGNESDSPNFWCTTGAPTSCGGGDPTTTPNIPSLQELVRMNWDALQIEHCLDPLAKALSPSFHVGTAQSWFHNYNLTSITSTALVAGTNGYPAGCPTIASQAVTGKMTYDFVNVHPRGGTAVYPTIGGNWNTAAIITAFNNTVAEVTADNIQNPSIIFGDEFGYNTSVEGGTTVQGFCSYVMQVYSLGASLGFTQLYWYQWDTTTIGLAGTFAGTCYDTLAGWMVGSSVGAYTTASGFGALIGNLYTIPVFHGRQTELIAWDQTQTCTPSCTTSNIAFGSQYTSYVDSAGVSHPTTGGNGTAPVGTMPVLLVSFQLSPPSVLTVLGVGD